MTNGAHPDITIEQAVAANIPAIAALFTDSFKESVLHHCGKLPKPQAMEDVFALVYHAEPEAAFTARSSDGRVIGYCFAPARLSRLWRQAVLGGHIFKWGWRWITGRYGFGLYPVKMILCNKIAFLHSSFQPAKAANARILSIAVDRSWRGQGIAGRLMQAAITYFIDCGAPRVRLEVRPDNISAIRVYEKYGFIPDGCTYDSQGEWLIMVREMGQS
jgi:ribosomal protein S18 acetylase RimI-like enzyme